MNTRRIYMGDILFSKSQEDALARVREIGEEFGWRPVRSNEDADEVILHNLRLLDVFRLITSRKLRTLPRKGVVSEPKIVLPHLNWPILETLFPSILWLGRQKGLDTFANPYQFPPLFEMPKSTDRQRLASMVFSNKVSMSKGELYSLRRQVAKVATKVHVFGAGWQDPLGSRIIKVFKELIVASLNPVTIRNGARYLSVIPKHYFGTVDNKIATTSEYKVSIVIENSVESVTEKVFDAWVAGCIPVYVGPNLSDFGFPASLFIQAEPEINSVLQSLEEALVMDHELFLRQLKDWFEQSETARFWSWSTAMSRIYHPAAIV